MPIQPSRAHQPQPLIPGQGNTDVASVTEGQDVHATQPPEIAVDRLVFTHGDDDWLTTATDLPVSSRAGASAGMSALFLSVPDFYSQGTGISQGNHNVEPAPGRLRGSHREGVEGKMFSGSMSLQDSYDCFGHELGLSGEDFDILMSIARNEGNIDAINTYDGAILSFGFMQWTATHELADLLHKMKEVDPQEFQQFFGRHGLDVVQEDGRWELTLNGERLDSDDDKWGAFFGNPPNRESIEKWENIFYTSRNAESMHKAQLLMGKERIDAVKSLSTGTGHTIGDYVQSAYGLTQILDYHVNRPTFAKEAFQEALASLGSPAPGEISEEALVAAFANRRIARQDGTDAAARVDVIDQKFSRDSSISDGVYTVRPNDGLWGIARRFQTTPDALREANPGLSDSLHTGQALKIPGFDVEPPPPFVPTGGASYTVASGDTLYAIARAHGTSVDMLYQLNPELNGSPAIQPGQRLQVSAEANTTSHRVKPGDTLYALSVEYGVTLEALLAANGLEENSVLTVGQVLELPSEGARMHTVVRGDTLYDIANEYGITVNDLRRANPQLGRSSVIRAGQQLKIQGASGRPTSVSHASGTSSVNTSTSGMSESEKYDHYKSLIEDHGGTFRSGANARNIISLRTETDADVRGGHGRYDDMTALVWVDANGRKRVREYQSNTEPSGRYRGRIGVDANGDGRRDLGRLPAGFYEYRTDYSSKFGHILRPTRSTNAERDTNQDGLFNDNAFASAGRSMLFHKGGRNSTGSAGCQTMPPDVFNRFWRDLTANGRPGNIGYTLINR